MALIDCPECGREVSSNAPTCPECAYPVASGTPPIPPSAVRVEASRPRDRWWSGVLPVVTRLTISGILMAAGVDEESVAAVVGAGIIGLSAFPVWYRRKIERLQGGSTGAIADALERRIVALEKQHRAEIAGLEERQAGQIADLEERIDFTERLLTKNREQIGPG